MKIFRPTSIEGYEWALPVNDAHYETFASLGATPVAASWSPIEVRLVSIAEQGRPSMTSDFPWLGRHVLILRERAATVLGAELASYGELLPLVCADAELWVFHVCHVIDALDLDRSKIIHFRDTGGIMMIDSHIFRSEVVDDYLVFKIPQFLRGSMFLSERFTELVESAELCGLGFTLVWDSERKPIVLDNFGLGSNPP